MRYIWDVYNYSYDTNDASLLQSISGPNCDFCRGIIDELRESKASKTRNEGGRIKVLVVATPPGKVAKSIVVSSVLRQQAGRAVGSDNHVQSTSPAIEAINAHALLRWKLGEWQLGALNLSKTN